MSPRTFSFDATQPGDTTDLAVRMGQSLHAGDVILLEGPVGAGKTHFARGMIQSLLTEPEDVPSPTFTLVQVYDTSRGPLWHTDLYRVGSVFEIEELGLSEAFQTAICLVEWPDRLGPLRPDSALTLTLSEGAELDSRRLKASWQDPRWDDMVPGCMKR